MKFVDGERVVREDDARMKQENYLGTEEALICQEWAVRVAPIHLSKSEANV